MGVGWSAASPSHFTPGKDPVPIVQEAGWADLDGCGKSRLTGVRSPDRPARSESLYPLRYPGRHVARKEYKNCGLKASKENTVWETLA